MSDWLRARGGYQPVQPEGYDVMQVCLHGHMITASAGTMPNFAKAFCPDCGAKTITACPQCNANIQGAYNSPGVIGFGPREPTGYCHNCGAPYPWTAERLAVADEMIDDLERLKADDKAKLKEALRDITTDTPRTELGVSRFIKLAKKAGVAVGSGLYKVAIDVASEAAKKAIVGT
jgi:hypothetical protein